MWFCKFVLLIQQRTQISECDEFSRNMVLRCDHMKLSGLLSTNKQRKPHKQIKTQKLNNKKSKYLMYYKVALV